jgi:hypothetical protein
MTPDELKSLIVLTGGRRLELDVAALGSAQLLNDLGSRFVLAAASRTETADGVTVSGRGEGGPFHSLDVTAEFTESGTTVVGAGTENWSFTDAYPQLAHTIFDTLRFSAPTLRLDSAVTGLTFTGTLIITAAMAPLDLLMRGVTHSVTGEIQMVRSIPDSDLPVTAVPSILLYGPAGAALDLGLFSLSGLRYEVFADPFMDYEIGDLITHGRLVVTGSVPFSANGTRHDILIGTEITDWNASLQFTADFTDVGQVAIDDVADFLGHSLALPGELEFTAPILPTEVTVLVTPSGQHKISAVSIKLETQEEWDIGLFVIQAVDVTFRLDGVGTDPRLTVGVTGLFGIGEHGTLEVTAGLGDAVSLGGALRAGDDPLTIREIYQDFTGAADAAHLPDLAVTHFDLSVELPPDGRATGAQGSIELTGQWPIVDGVVLEDVKFALRTGEATEFDASAELVIAEVGLFVTASYDPVEAWRFSGGTLPDQVIPIGAVIAHLAAAFGELALPAPIAQLTLHDLATSFTTATKRFTFTGGARFPIDTTEVDLAVEIDTYARAFGGRIVVTTQGGVELNFDVHFASRPEATEFAVTYSHGPTDPMPSIKELVAALSPTAAGYIPDGIAVRVQDAVLAVDDKIYVFGVDLTATIDLAKLPVIGPRLTGDQVVGFDPLRVIAASAALTAAEATALNALLPPDAAKLPEQDVQQGFTVGGRLRLGALETPVSLPVTPGQTAPATPQQAQTGDNVLWYKVQTAYGPVHVARVGLTYRHPPNEPARLAVLLDAAISVGGLTLTCDGLSAGISLSDLAALPDFGLSGLGISYAEGPVQISGAFLNNTVTYKNRVYPAYSGKAVIATETFAAGALGSYIQLDEGPSLFVYAFLDYPIGGPAFFFVRGLAAGFGYNRRLIAPDVAKIVDFPLVAEAAGGKQPTTLAGELQRLEYAIPPSPGDYFLAIGVHFTSFEMIDSVLLLIVGFGHRFEMNVLGLSTLTLPAPRAAAANTTPIAEIQLALKATFAPDDGYFSLLAQLTPNSYMLNRSCRLTGGFAFVTWFGPDHTGDFVLTAGGYHPHFGVPPHYPAVPRLGFNWQVSRQLTLKGSAYYALTPSALMAGGSLSATWEDGSLRAWFDTALDFLIAWQPYHYEAAFRLGVGASYTFSTIFGTHTITAHVGTDVRFWGPEFGGTATIDLDIISFTIRFGSTGGTSPDPVKWSAFRAAQLPPAAKITTIALRGGAVHSGDGTDLGVINPRELELVTDAVIPSTEGRAGGTVIGRGAAFGIAPAGRHGDFTARHEITITKDGAPAEQYFRYEPVTKDLPAALWGAELVPSLTKPALVKNLLTGYVIRAVRPAEPAHQPSVPLTDLQPLTALFTEQNAFAWRPLAPFQPAADQRLDLDAAAATRAAVAGKLLPDAVVDLNGLTAADFLQTPQVAAHV